MKQPCSGGGTEDDNRPIISLIQKENHGLETFNITLPARLLETQDIVTIIDKDRAVNFKHACP